MSTSDEGHNCLIFFYSSMHISYMKIYETTHFLEINNSVDVLLHHMHLNFFRSPLLRFCRQITEFSPLQGKLTCLEGTIGLLCDRQFFKKQFVCFLIT